MKPYFQWILGDIASRSSPFVKFIVFLKYLFAHILIICFLLSILNLLLNFYHQKNLTLGGYLTIFSFAGTIGAWIIESVISAKNNV